MTQGSWKPYKVGSISLEDAAMFTRGLIKPCTVCHGDGRVAEWPGDEVEQCRVCDGAGYFRWEQAPQDR